jgi:hypothetical protein
MKKLLLLLLLAPTLLMAQDADDKLKRVTPERDDQLLVDLTHDRLSNLPTNMKSSFWSRGVNTNLMWDQTIKNTTGFFSVYNDSYEYKKNKLVTVYSDIPVEIRWRSKVDVRGYKWGVAVGGKFGYLLSAHSKVVDSNGKFKTYNYTLISPLRYGATMRVSYGKVGLWGYWSLSELLDVSTIGSNSQSGIVPFSIGVTLSVF